MLVPSLPSCSALAVQCLHHPVISTQWHGGDSSFPNYESDLGLLAQEAQITARAPVWCFVHVKSHRCCTPHVVSMNITWLDHLHSASTSFLA